MARDIGEDPGRASVKEARKGSVPGRSDEQNQAHFQWCKAKD